MRGKIFTPTEANRMLPLVSRIADDIVATYAQVHHVLRQLEAEKARIRASVAEPATPEVPNPDVNPQPESVETTRLETEIARLLDRFQGLVEEIEALGGTVKDYERGCVDFYGEVDGEIVYLCWQRGEDAISHWHRLDAGYEDRNRIPLSSAA